MRSLKLFGAGHRWWFLGALCIFALLALVRRRPGFPAGITAALVVLGGFTLGLAFVSETWSSDGRLTIHRAVAVTMVITAAACLAAVAAADTRVSRDVAIAIVAAVASLNAGGFLLLLSLNHDAALGASIFSPWRFQGLGENPNTVSMLAGITMPLGVWAVLASTSRRWQIASGAALALSFTAITLSGSRGAFAAAVVGMLAMTLLLYGVNRRALRLAAATGIAAVASLVLSQIPQPSVASVVGSPTTTPSSTTTTPSSTTTTPSSTTTTPSSTTTTPSSTTTTPSSTTTTPPAATTGRTTTTVGATTTSPAAGTVPATTTAPSSTTVRSPTPPLVRPIDSPLGVLGAEVGTPPAAGRSLFGSSGRVQAWSGAIDQANQRPFLGYGFGTEARVFFDRYQTFESFVVENSFIGLYLQLGAIGLAAFLAVAGTIAAAGMRDWRARTGNRDPLFAALLGVFAGGIVLMFVQSYAYSAGNVSTLPYWLCACLVVSASTSTANGGSRSTRLLGQRKHFVTVVAVGGVLLVLLVPLGRWQKDRALAQTARHMRALAAVAGPSFRSHLSGSRLSRGVDCLLYEVRKDQTAIELCFSADGHLAEAIDRRRGDTVEPRFLSLLDEPVASVVHPPVATLLARFHEAGALRHIPVTAARLPIGGTDYAPKMIASRKGRANRHPPR